MNELIGKTCICIFSLPPEKWPIAGYPAFVVVESVDMPMLKMRSFHTGESIWINAMFIESIKETRLKPQEF